MWSSQVSPESEDVGLILLLAGLFSCVIAINEAYGRRKKRLDHERALVLDYEDRLQQAMQKHSNGDQSADPLAVQFGGKPCDGLWGPQFAETRSIFTLLVHCYSKITIGVVLCFCFLIGMIAVFANPFSLRAEIYRMQGKTWLLWWPYPWGILLFGLMLLLPG